MNKGNRQNANYTEDAISLAIESFLTIFGFPRFRFSVEPFSRSKERFLGADARLVSEMVGFRPFYMQFKRPSAFLGASTSRIVKDRKQLNLATQPSSLFFELRKKGAHHADFQHNILFKLRERLIRRGIGDAAYVCPLFLDRSAYRFHVHMAGLSRWTRFWRFDPWELEHVLINDRAQTIRFERIPILSEHISIPPHALVDDANHSYSFTDRGQGLCFHSPTALPDRVQTLAAFLKSISEGFLKGGGNIEPQTANDELRKMFFADPVDDFRLSFEFDSDGDPIGNWLAWGEYLSEAYEIEQYAMIKWTESDR